MDSDELSVRLATMLAQHRDFDAEIVALIASGNLDQLRIARLKKQKLRLKDEIAAVQDMMIPDIIA